MTNYAASERVALCDLLDSLSPDAATLCAGWTAYDLAVHLVVRERSPKAMPGIAIQRFAGRTEQVMAEFKATHPFTEAVRIVRGGPPGWSPMRAPGVGDAANLLEFLVHHEDLRRAQPHWVPRALPTDLADAVWSRLRLVARLAFRRSQDGVVLQRTGTEAQITGKRDKPSVTVSGDPIEVALYCFDRRSVARVELHGDSDAIARLATTRIGL